MTSIQDLPIELIQYIALIYPNIYYAFSLIFNIKLSQKYLKSHFTTIVKINSAIYYRLPSNQLHRENDLPAIIYAEGSQCWYYNNKLHRENDLPAMIFSNGTKRWYYNNQRHRENDLPAVISSDGQYWYYHDQLHRENDLPAIIRSNGQYWYYHDQLHRENDLPAVISSDGTQKWYYHGKNIRRIIEC